MANEATEHGVQLIDTTCPLVAKVQAPGAKSWSKQGYSIVVYGRFLPSRGQGIIGWSGTSRAYPAKKLEDLPWNAPRGSKDPDAEMPPRKVAIVSQTTKNSDEFMEFCNKLSHWVLPEGGKLPHL
ncbi:MAG: hypothetical protein R2849_20075 [Thermomicrobiales bacterium]